MASRGEILLSQWDIYKNIGTVILLRSSINLVSTMLDLPEIFWDNEILEKLYYLSRDYYDIDDWIGIVNKWLGLIKEIFDILNGDHMSR